MGMSWLGVPHLFMVNSITGGSSGSLPCSHPGPAGTGATGWAVPWSQLRAGSPAVGRAGICQGTIDTHVLPTCFLPILQGTANVATATSRSLPTLPGLPSPSISPGAALPPSPKHLAWGWLAKAHLLRHGWWRAGPARGQGRAASSWVSGSAALLRLCGLEQGRAPASTVCSACPGGRKQTAQGQNRGKGAEMISHPASPTVLVCLGGDRTPHAQRQLLPSPGAGRALVREQGGTAGQSQEPVLRSCHTHFITSLMV